jgi:hypothetical protein
MTPLLLFLDVAVATQLGTANPLTFQAAGRDGRWVVACQAREDTNHDGKVSLDVGYHGDMWGDKLEPYFIAGGGAGERIDDIVDQDPNGRWLALIVGGKLILRDVQGKDVELRGADARDDGDPFGHHRAASFDAAGIQLVYFRDRKLVVRTLATGAENVIDPGPGEPWRARFDPDGGWVEVEMIAEDTNKNGKLDWPRTRTSLSPRLCRGPITSYGTYGMDGDQPTERVAQVNGKQAKEVKNLIRPFGSKLLTRRQDGAVVADEVLVPAACKGKLLQADGKRGKVLVVCADGDVQLHGPGLHKSLAFKTEVPGDDEWRRDTPRLVPVGERYVDMDKNVAASAGGRVVATWNGTGVFVADNKLAGMFDVDHPAKQTLFDIEDSYGEVSAGPIAVVPPLVFDMATQKVLGRVKGRVLAASSDGRVLVAEPGGPIPKGPLRWVRPTP